MYLDNFTTGIEYEGKLFNVALWDTAGQEEYSRLRALSYPGTDVFLICFSVVSEASYDNVRSRWYPEVMHHWPEAKKLLVGLKTDLRGSGEYHHASSYDDGINLAKKLNCDGYVECSSLTQSGLANVFSSAVSIVSEGNLPSLSKKKTPQPPSLPPAPKAPWINVETSSYLEDRRKLLSNHDNCDVCFIIGKNNSFPKHSLDNGNKNDKTFEYIDESIDEDLLCCICLEPFENGVSHSLELCRNCFCKNCLSKVSRCPLCRETLNKKDITLIPRLVQNSINSLKVKCKSCDEITSRKEFDTHICNDINVKQETLEFKREKINEYDLPPHEEFGQTRIWAHQYILASSSKLFRRLFHVDYNKDNLSKQDFISKNSIRNGGINGFCDMNQVQSDTSNSITYFTLEPDIQPNIFQYILEFIYCGEASKLTKKDVDEVKRVAKIFNCDELVTICQNIQENNEWLNPSIATWLNDINGAILSELFFLKNENNTCDIKLENGIQYHSSLLSVRAPKISTISYSKIPNLISTLLNYVYSDHCDIHPENQIQLMQIAYEMKITRLISLCELYISKTIEKETAEKVEEAKINIIEILNIANLCNAKQLQQFCLHFISTNYEPMKQRKEWKQLNSNDRKYIEENKWPPQHYLDELAEFESKQNKKSKNSECLIQ